MEDSSWWEWDKIPDAPWWYNERALLSQFAGAIWRCKGRALEEFVATKRELKLRRKARRKDTQGSRGDLEFWWPQDKFFYVSEAKLHWPSIRANPTKLRDHIGKWLTECVSQVRRHPHAIKGRRL